MMGLNLVPLGVNLYAAVSTISIVRELRTLGFCSFMGPTVLFRLTEMISISESESIEGEVGGLISGTGDVIPGVGVAGRLRDRQRGYSETMLMASAWGAWGKMKGERAITIYGRIIILRIGYSNDINIRLQYIGGDGKGRKKS